MFDRLKNGKKKIDLELKDYYCEQSQGIFVDLAELRIKRNFDRCELEKSYYSKKTECGIEIANLEAEIYNKKAMLEAKKYQTELMQEKDNTIKQLQDVIKSLTDKDVLVYSGQKLIKND